MWGDDGYQFWPVLSNRNVQGIVLIGGGRCNLQVGQTIFFNQEAGRGQIVDMGIGASQGNGLECVQRCGDKMGRHVNPVFPHPFIHHIVRDKRHFHALQITNTADKR